jgi:hypothetical protein
VLPLEDGEVLFHRHRYLKKEDQEPPRFLVVRSAADVDSAGHQRRRGADLELRRRGGEVLAGAIAGA